MDNYGPTPEQMRQDTYEPPQLDQRTARATYKRKTAFERLRGLEPEHREAARRLDRHFHGAAGSDVRWDDAPKGWGPPDEFAIHRHARELAAAEKAVGSPRAWSALLMMVEELMSPEAIGHQWGGYKTRAQAKVYGDTLIIAGLDALALHWGLIKRPDG